MIERLLWAISMYGHKNKKGMVEIRLEDKRIQTSVQEAKDFAHSILEAAEAAETDDFLMTYLLEKVGITEEENRAKVLMDFRMFRDKKRREKP